MELKLKKKMHLMEDDRKNEAMDRRTSVMDAFTAHAKAQISRRKKIKIFINDVDETPKVVVNPTALANFDKLGMFHKKPTAKSFGSISELESRLKSFDEKNMGGQKSVVKSMRQSMDELVTKISITVVSLDDEPFWRTQDLSQLAPKKPAKYIKINLTETENITLYSKNSTTVAKHSTEATAVDEDNKTYDYFTIGKGKMRRRVEAQTQTMGTLFKSRYCNTDQTKTGEMASYVSNFEMFDTYKKINNSSVSIAMDMDGGDGEGLIKEDASASKEEMYENMFKSPQFQLAVMRAERVLAGNVFSQKQKIFRNMYLPDPLALNVKYDYTVNILWKMKKQSEDRRAVNVMCWCPGNGDLLAVSYGPYSFIPVKNETVGYMVIWSIKNPVNPERRYNYQIPVTALQFSQFLPQLLAIGLHDGTVEVRDISSDSEIPIGIAQPDMAITREPITQIRWIELGAGEHAETEPMLVSSQDGTVTKYRIVNTPYLSGFQQMKLDRVEGTPEGLQIHIKESLIESIRNPQAISITIHPTKKDIYYVLTDEGCLHKCSVNYPHQHIELLKVHDGNVYSMEFSPWSPKLFLTCGSDFCTRIWLEGILQPLIKLSSGFLPVHCAYWSKTHSTIIITVTRKCLEIWDISKSILHPVTSKSFSKPYLSIFNFSLSGRSLAVGNEKGNVFVCSFENMPFPPHFQYKELEAAVYKALLAFPDLTNEVKTIGYFGYPEKKVLH